ncbi:MAG: hypothetical protein APR55_00450 [Methanolinea sp. SDB]|nr:MAG: hypothetical protein APR55_00450 [Methanolinea sp. SDB]
MPILYRARYENRTLKPIGELPLKEGETVTFEIKKSIADAMYGLLPLDEETVEEIIEWNGWD